MKLRKASTLHPIILNCLTAECGSLYGAVKFCEVGHEKYCWSEK